jgi:hypothetical protein
MEDQNDETYLAELQACKLDFLEWSPEKGVKVSDTSKQFARDFLNSLVIKDLSKNDESNGAKKTFNKIASLLFQCKIETDGMIPKATIDKIAELSGTTDRRVYTVLEALETEGWQPSKSYEEK